LRRDQVSFLSRRQILGEVLFNAILREEQEPVGLRPQLIGSGRLGKSLADFADRLASVWRKGRDVDQTHDLGIIPSLGDHDAPVRMTDENGRTVLRRDRPPGRGHIVGE
jgi:hypothetical protein